MKVLGEALSYVYYPGCSLHATAKEYDISSQSACRALGIKLEEIKGWNCCGATALPSLDYDTFIELNTKNLQLAAKQGTSVVTPCNECFKNLKDTKKMLASKGKAPNVGVRHLFQAIYEDVGMENLAKAVKRPLKDLKVVSYYGCLLTRTDPEFDDIERPVKLDEMAEVLGATVIKFPGKMWCCGGPVYLTEKKIALNVTKRILDMAKSLGADVIQVICPLCSMMLDVYQDQVEGEPVNIPILYFTQMIGLALGLKSDDLGLDLNIVSTKPLLKKLEGTA
ncbi:MAG: CoB--CoM heterodisulfide reductase iron-sulfur subunit B family protein [Thermoplasmata archaeon]